MKKLFCILFCLTLLGCQEQNTERPAHLISEAEMVRIMADIHLAEAQIESTVAYPDTALMLFKSIEKEILQKHGVTEQQFRETYNYYTSHVPEMDKLYEIITDTLIAREAKYVNKNGEQESSNPPVVERNLEEDSTRRRLRLRRKLDTIPGN